MSKKINVKILYPLLPFLTLFIFSNSVYAQAPTSFVSISVKLSLCGDYTIEGPEECEGEDLNGTTCESLGFQEGSLTCDPACSFNTFLCIPYPEPQIPETEEEDIEVTEEENLELTQLKQEDETKKNQFLKVFDKNGDGILTSDEIPTIVVTWINFWTKSKTNPLCDLNNDSKCDIYDFSILLYLIDNDGI